MQSNAPMLSTNMKRKTVLNEFEVASMPVYPKGINKETLASISPNPINLSKKSYTINRLCAKIWA
jgi:hypothetical protein